MNWLKEPLAKIAEAVQAGEVTAESLAKESLAKIKSDDLHAILDSSELALTRAKQIDQQVKEGKKIGPLAGVPYIAKDNFLTHGTYTTAASRILEKFSAPYQSTAVEKLEQAGAVMVAKANLDAFAHGSSTENSDFGPTLNPVDHSRVPGGSSGGSAAAVAAGYASFAIGTDTGSSVRLPASFCGVVGMKPSYGLVSRYGVIAMGSSMDVIGPLARRVEDAGLILDVMSGPDGFDSTLVARDSSYILGTAKMDFSGIRFGLIKQYLGNGVASSVKSRVLATAAMIEQSGGKIEEVDIPAIELALACYYILVPAEVSSNLARFDGVKYGYSDPRSSNLAETYALSRDHGFGAEAKRRIMMGTFVLSSGYYDAYYRKAQTVRSLLVKEFAKAFNRFDFLLGPNAPTTAFPLGQKASPLEMYMTDVMLVSTNLVGGCAISLPCGVDESGLPIGVQLIGKQGDDKRLLLASATVEDLLEKGAK